MIYVSVMLLYSLDPQKTSVSSNILILLLGRNEKKSDGIEKNSKLVQNRRQHITFYKNKNKYKNNLRVFKESVPERKNGALGDHVGDCVFLGTQANLQARSQDSAQGR